MAAQNIDDELNKAVAAMNENIIMLSELDIDHLPDDAWVEKYRKNLQVLIQSLLLYQMHPDPTMELRYKYISIIDILDTIGQREQELFGEIMSSSEDEYNEDDYGDDIPRGCTKAQIKQHTQNIPFAQLTNTLDQQSCTICMEPFDSDTQVQKLHCNHIYHIDCLSHWLTIRKTCPLCLSNVLERPPTSDISKHARPVSDNPPMRRQSKRLRGLPP